MEWLTDLVTENGRMLARGVSKRGEVELYDPNHLDRRGAVLKGLHVHLDAAIDFSKLKRVDATEALTFLKVAVPEPLANKHAVFLYNMSGRYILIPALVLMRAIFEHSGHFLGAMFEPKSLGRITKLGNDGKLSFAKDWGQFLQFIDPQETHNLLEWMLTNEHGMAMVESIHTHATSGRIDVTPPPGFRKVRMRGFDTRKYVLVTQLRLTAGGWYDQEEPKTAKELRYRRYQHAKHKPIIQMKHQRVAEVSL